MEVGVRTAGPHVEAEGGSEKEGAETEGRGGGKKRAGKKGRENGRTIHQERMGGEKESDMVVGYQRSNGRSRELKVMCGNVQSLVNKVDELRAVISSEKPDIMALTETWTHGGIGDEIVSIDGYEMIAREDRNDTAKGRGGGVIVYSKKDVIIRKIEQQSAFIQLF